MKKTLSNNIDLEILKSHQKDKIQSYQMKINSTTEKIYIDKNILADKFKHKTKSNKNNNKYYLSQNVDSNYESNKNLKLKIMEEDLIDPAGDNQFLNGNKVVKNFSSPKNEISPYLIGSQKSQNKKIFLKINNNFINRNLKFQQYSSVNFNENNEKNIDVLNNKNEIDIKNEKPIVDISDSDDESFIINNEIDNDTENLSQIINTTFPKLSSNPFLVENKNNNNIFHKNNNDRILFSLDVINKKEKFAQQSTNKSPSITKTIISINSSTTLNSNDTIYNFDSKRKKINELNSYNYIEGDTYNEKFINISQINNEKINNLIIISLLNLIKNGEEEKFLENIKKFSPNNLMNLDFQEKESGNSILHYACERQNIQIIKNILKFNCDPNLKNKNLETPLHLVSKKGDLEICKLLIEKGALLNIYDINKKTPIHYAFDNNYKDLVNYFYEIFIETNTDKKSSYDLIKNKEISSLFRKYIKIKENNNKGKMFISNKTLQDINKKDNNKEQLVIQSSIDNKNKNNDKEKYNKNPNQEKTRNKCIKKEKNKVNEKKSKNNLDNFKENNNNEISSNLSLNDLNDTSDKDKNIIINNLNKFKYKKLKRNINKNILLNRKNYSKKTSYNPFAQDLQNQNNSLCKNKGNEINFDINKTYDNENSKINRKININISHKYTQKNINKNNLTSQEIDVNQINYNHQNNKRERSYSKVKSAYKNLNIYSHIKEKKGQFHTENKGNNKNGKNFANKDNNNKDISNIFIKKNLNSLYKVPGSKKKFSTKNEAHDQGNKTVNNINIHLTNTSINTSIYLSFSQNLNLIKEKDKVSTKDFLCLALLGRGSFGEVYLVQKISTKKNYAMKVLRKERIMGQNLSKYAIAERNVLSLSNHPFIVKLNYAFQNSTKLFLILEYCPGGDLSKHLSIEKRFKEDRAKFYLCEILLALEDLHKRNIIFRDLKPDNVVLDNEGHCKLTDFGLSKEGIDSEQNTKSFCGSLAYLAPEVLKKQGHGKAVDWYLLGVLFYEMIVGITPYYDPDKNTLFLNIEQGNLYIPDYISEDAKNLLRGLLQRDPKKRLGGGNRDAEEIKEHIFFKDIDWKKIYNKKIKPPPAIKLVNNSMIVFDKPKYFADENNLGEFYGENSLKGWTFINKCEI